MDLDTVDDDPRVGDRWRHDVWPPGTPDALVGEVIKADGFVLFIELGGMTRRGGVLRFMTPSRGWRKQPRIV